MVSLLFGFNFSLNPSHFGVLLSFAATPKATACIRLVLNKLVAALENFNNYKEGSAGEMDCMRTNTDKY